MHTINTPTHPERASCGLKRSLTALAIAGALAAPLSGWAQVVPLPFEAEGVVTDIFRNTDGSVELTVFGRKMLITSGATIETPTATLTLDRLADPTRFPGRMRDGFLGGTAILIGEVGTDATGAATPLITNVTIEPAETVLLGALTKNDGGQMALLGVPMKESTDPRLPSRGYHNEFGFPVNPLTIPVGVFAAIEGYFADDGNFYHFAVEASGGTLTDPLTPQSSVTRARCASGGRLEVQGASYLPAAASFEIRNANTDFYFGTISTTVDPLTPDFGTYRYRFDVNEGEVDSAGACPSRVRAVNLSNGSEAVLDVDGVTAPPVAAPPPPQNVPPVAVDDIDTVFVGLATEVHLTANDTDANGNLDVTTVQLGAPPAGLTVQNQGDGNVIVIAAAAGVYTFTYTVSDTDGAVSAPATVTITAQPVAMDTLDITRANYATSKNRWEIRGNTNRAGVTVTVTLARTGQTIDTVTADATGFWKVDVRNSGIVGASGDSVRATSSGGGNDVEVVNIIP